VLYSTDWQFVTEDRGSVGRYMVQTGNLLEKIEVLWGVMW